MKILDVIDTIFLETKDMGFISSVNQVFCIPPDTIKSISSNRIYAYSVFYYLEIFSKNVLVSSSVKGLILGASVYNGPRPRSRVS